MTSSGTAGRNAAVLATGGWAASPRRNSATHEGYGRSAGSLPNKGPDEHTICRAFTWNSKHLPISHFLFKLWTRRALI